MEIEVTLHLSQNRKIAFFHIPIIYKNKILQFKGIESVVTCLDFKPSIKFVAKMTIKSTNNYPKYLFNIPRRHISIIISPIKKVYKINITKF